MFKKGDFITYGTVGVCEVQDIRTINMEGVSKDKLYYILRPYYQTRSKVFTPVDNKKTVMRKILSKEEACTLIDHMQEVEKLEISPDKMQEEVYKQAVRTGDCKEWIRIIRTLYDRRQERLAQGKKAASVEERYFKMAEENLFSELSISLGIPKEELHSYIESRLHTVEAK